MIRRKSDADRQLIVCTYHEQMDHERNNQITHERRQQDDPDHEPWSSCWCCCTDCSDLTWHYPPRKGVWWRRTASGELQLIKETSAASPGSPETSTS